MKDRVQEDKERGIVVMPNIDGFSQKYNRIARRHGFKVANITERRVRDLVGSAKTPLGNKISGVVYNIPCYCKKNMRIPAKQTECGDPEKGNIKIKFDLRCKT